MVFEGVSQTDYPKCKKHLRQYIAGDNLYTSPLPIIDAAKASIAFDEKNRESHPERHRELAQLRVQALERYKSALETRLDNQRAGQNSYFPTVQQGENHHAIISKDLEEARESVT